MNKLGFAIKLASQGAGNAIECNKGQWTNKVVDIREYLKLFDGLQGTDNIVTFMSFDEEGCFLTQFRAISGRVGDFLSGWIYIPNTIEASGEDVMNTYNYVRNILSQSNLNDYISDIESFFSKEYPKKEYVVSYVPSSGEEFGVRFNNMYYSMKEILDTDRYQPYYSKYKAIFLLDKDGEVKISKEQVAKFKDLTKLSIDKTCILKAPSPEEVRRLGRGTKIIFQNNQEFKSSVLTKKGDKVQLYAIRNGFEPVALPLVMIQEDGQVMSIDPRTVKWLKRIKPSMFWVCNHKDEPIGKGVRISINDTDVTDQGILISEEDCRQALIKISATDYETFEQKRNLLNDNLKITLHREVKSTKTRIELSNGKTADMTIESKYLPSNSPLTGYEYDEYPGDKILRLSSWFVWKQRLLGFLAALAVVMLIIAYVAFNTWIDTHHFKFGLPPWEEDKPVQTIKPFTDDNIKKADVIEINEPQINQQTLDYLNQNDQWGKGELAKDSLTKGLYDMINNYRFDDILNVRIENCDKFNEIKEISERMISNGFLLSEMPYTNNGTITISKWIEKVNEKYKSFEKSKKQRSNSGSRVNNLTGKKGSNKAINGGL